MGKDIFPGIEISGGETEMTPQEIGGDTCRLCRYAQRTGGFHPGTTCLNRKSENYLRSISETQAACASIIKK